MQIKPMQKAKENEISTVVILRWIRIFKSMKETYNYKKNIERVWF